MLIASIINILFPHYCFSCRKIGPPLCPACAQEICFTSGMIEQHTGIDGLYACFSYKGVIKKTIRAGKYFSVRDALIRVCSYIQSVPIKTFLTICQRISPHCVLVPVPIHKRRRAERGFNQAEVIACQLSLLLRVPVRSDLVIRRRYTSAQAHLLKRDRMKNLQGAFTYVGTGDPPDGVIIVDDVWTTGSTVREVASVLKKTGVEHVWALTLAR